MRVGATFSATNASWLGLDPQRTLAQVIALGLDPIRLCGYWDQPAEALDWQLDQAQAAGRRVVLTVGMKAPRWPEFHFPRGRAPKLRRGGEVGSQLPVADAAVEQVSALVDRFRGCPAIGWWQVENEPLNRSGPDHWWIATELLAREVGAVRALDSRPLVLTAFGHFDRAVDELSGHHLLNATALRDEGSGVEPELLALLAPGDVLGVDIYHAIGHRLGPTAHAQPPGDYLRRWIAQAGAAEVDCWVTELQAEPWEAGNETLFEPRSVGPQDLLDRFDEVHAAGVRDVLLWGVEYWLAQAARGHAAWLETARSALARLA